MDPARPSAPTLLAFNIGLVTWETVDVIHKGANYGYPLREGTQSMSSTNGMGPLPADDVIPIQISDTVTRGTVKPTYPVIQYPHNRDAGGDAIANGFVYRGKLVPALKDKLVFGDITTGRIWYAESRRRPCGRRRQPDDRSRRFTRSTPACAGSPKRRIASAAGRETRIPGMGAQAGRGRVDLRFAVDNDGELYILTKSDGMIRKVVGAKTATTPTPAANVPAPGPGQNVTGQSATSARNPVASTPESIAAGKRAYDANCAACHGNLAQGAVKAGMTISIIEEQRGKQPPDLTDDQWDHGSSDGEIFAVIKRGVPPTMMAGFDGRIPDEDIWSIVNYLRTLR